MAGASQDARRPGYAELEGLVVAQAARIVELDALAARFEARITDQDRVIGELRQRLGENSRNSSKPPSSDGYGKPSAKQENRSLRKRSGRKPGAQNGHEGAHLERVEVPDERIEHEPEACEGCGGDLADAERVEDGESRQVFDLPEEIALGVIEHAAVRRLCEGCGQISAGSFPQGVQAPVQYGPGIHALGVYLHVFQHLPLRSRAAADLRHDGRRGVDRHLEGVGRSGRPGLERVRPAAALAVEQGPGRQFR